eukprot:TRINITY_DN2230_c0_g1_i2.p1 TRINITY_DN2230_c0_g1~~TRINITY_DN2230_c0_g1_i2.p1  ORF type:complete len:144 (+),score=23.90 TRINITY_DN2230_c0_g1_i2:26-457(+)
MSKIQVQRTPVPLKTRKGKHAAPALKHNIVPGQILVLLAGRFAGKRVVFLKQLTSGLLLVAGPYKINGVPLRRVNQVYVMPTSAKIEIGDFSSYDDETVKGEVDQAVVDGLLLEGVKSVPHMKEYLRSKFTLRNGQYPHMMKF